MSAGIDTSSKPALSGTKSTRGVICDPSGKSLILLYGAGEWRLRGLEEMKWEHLRFTFSTLQKGAWPSPAPPLNLFRWKSQQKLEEGASEPQ